MTKDKCQCGGAHQDKGSCAACLIEQDLLSYWCQTCNRAVAEKRCPYCGLKAQRKREPGPGAQRKP